MPRQPRLRVVDAEMESWAVYLVERGWMRTRRGWVHPNLYFEWSTDAALRLDAEADDDDDLADFVHGMLLGLF